MRLLKIAVCAMVGSILGGCFLSKIEVYDVSAGEVLAIANIDLVCTLADDSGSRGYVAKIVPLGDPKANRYDFALLFHWRQRYADVLDDLQVQVRLHST